MDKLDCKLSDNSVLIADMREALVGIVKYTFRSEDEKILLSSSYFCMISKPPPTPDVKL